MVGGNADTDSFPERIRLGCFNIDSGVFWSEVDVANAQGDVGIELPFVSGCVLRHS